MGSLVAIRDDSVKKYLDKDYRMTLWVFNYEWIFSTSRYIGRIGFGQSSILGDTPLACCEQLALPCELLALNARYLSLSVHNLV